VNASLYPLNNKDWSNLLGSYQKTECNSDVLIDILDYESEALSQFINLGASSISKETQSIQSHKVKPEALASLTLRLVHQKTEHYFDVLIDLLDYESKAPSQFINLCLSSISKET
jgi:predicted RNA-binding protein Jag